MSRTTKDTLLALAAALGCATTAGLAITLAAAPVIAGVIRVAAWVIR